LSATVLDCRPAGVTIAPFKSKRSRSPQKSKQTPAAQSEMPLNAQPNCQRSTQAGLCPTSAKPAGERFPFQKRFARRPDHSSSQPLLAAARKVSLTFCLGVSTGRKDLPPARSLHRRSYWRHAPYASIVGQLYRSPPDPQVSKMSFLFHRERASPTWATR